MISSRYNPYIPETETETETEIKASSYSDDFESFWKAYEKPVFLCQGVPLGAFHPHLRLAKAL